MKRFLLFMLSLFTVVTGFAATETVIETWQKVTSAPTTWDGDYLIVYEEGSVAFDGSLATLDAGHNTQSVTITDGKIETTDCNFYFTIAAIDGGYSIKSASGSFIGNSSDGNALKTDKSYVNTIKVETDGIGIISAKSHLRFNSATGSSSYRFRYYKSSSYTGQKAIQLYKKVTEAPTPDTKVYFNNSKTAWETVYVYAWDSSTGDYKNAEWPGEAATYNASTGLYEYTVNGEFNKVIFNNGKNGGSQTPNLDLVLGNIYNDKLPETMFVIGNIQGITSWDTNSGLALENKGNNVFEINNVTVKGNEGYGYFYFIPELKPSESWNDITVYGSVGANTEVTTGQSADVYLFRQQSWKLANGTYKFILDLNTMKLTVSEPMPEHVYLMGHITVNEKNYWKPEFGLEMTQTSNGIFEIDNVYVGEEAPNAGKGTIGFTTVLDPEWKVVDPARYGSADSNGYRIYAGRDYNVAKNTNSWTIASGQYKFTLNLISNTLKVEAATSPVTYISDLSKVSETTGAFSVAAPATAVAQQGSNLWIKDNSGWMLVYGGLGGVTYQNGDVIPAGYGGTYIEYNGLPEMQNPTGFVAATEKVDPVQPQKITATSLANATLNSYVELKGKVTLDEGKTRNYTLTDDTGSAAIYTSSKDITVKTGDKVVVRGFVSVFNNTRQITPVESFEYPTIAAPSFGVPGGIVAKGTEVRLTGPEGATVKYQINGESEAYTEYTKPIVINKNTTLSAIAELNGYLSDPVEMTYQVRVSSAPVITPASGEVAAGTELSFAMPNDAPDGAAIFVKWGDDEDFIQFFPGTDKITIEEAATVTAVVAMPSVTAEGMDETDFIRSEETTATYTIAPASVDKIYIIGNIPSVGWDPSSDKAPLVKNTEGKYVIEEVTISDNYGGYGWFCFLDQLGANANDWSVNDGHRYGPKVKDTEVNVGEATELGLNGDNSWKIKAGTYKMVVDLNAKTFVATEVTPTVVIPEKLYIYGYVNGNEWNPETGIEMTKVDDGIFRIDHANIESYGTFFFSPNIGSWDDINANKYGAVNENDREISEFPATKTLAKVDYPNNIISFQVAPDKYNIVVNLINNTMYIEQMTYPENVYVIGDISRHHWEADYTGAKMRMENDGKYHIYGVKLETQYDNEVAFFTLSTMPSTDWDVVNANQYGAAASNTAIESEVETEVMKGTFNWTAAPGTYDITFDFENLKLTVKANSETNTIYYKPAEGETMVYMYAYKTSTPYTRAATGPVNAIWPGEPISVEESKDNTGYIRCEVSNTFDKIEFNDGTSRGVAIDNVPNRNYSRTVYLIGDATDWTPDACIEMKEEKGFLSSPVYVIDRLTIEAKADGEKNYFHLTATQGETADDWDNVNAGAFGAPEADTQAVVDGTTENRVLIGSNHGWIIPAGEFEVKFKPAENVLILKDLDPAGINNVDAEAENAEFYNIQGIRMNKSQKGLNIIRRNGKTYKTAVR